MPLELLALAWGNTFIAAWALMLGWVKLDIINVIIALFFLAVAIWLTVLEFKSEKGKKHNDDIQG